MINLNTMRKRRSPQRKKITNSRGSSRIAPGELPERRLKAGDLIPLDLVDPFPHPRLRSSKLRPSTATDAPWLFAYRQHGDYPMHTSLGGKWLIFVDHVSVDEVWGKVLQATEEGLLGGSSKVSTAKKSQRAGTSNAHVICVYTHDFTNEADVRRVREKLRQIGITAKIPYKADQETRSGKYAVLGHKNLSKYYE